MISKLTLEDFGYSGEYCDLTIEDFDLFITIEENEGDNDITELSNLMFMRDKLRDKLDDEEKTFFFLPHRSEEKMIINNELCNIETRITTQGFEVVRVMYIQEVTGDKCDDILSSSKVTYEQLNFMGGKQNGR